MNRTRSRTLALLGIAATVLAGSAPARADWTGAPLRHVILTGGAPASAREVIGAFAGAGAHVAVFTPPRTALVFADDAALQSAAIRPFVARADAGAVDPSSLRGESDTVLRSARVWNELLRMRARTAAAGVPGHDHAAGSLHRESDARHVPVALPPRPELRDAPTHIPYGAQYYDTSSFLAGTTAVGVWLLEASGSTYDWSAAEETETLAGVQSGLAWWVTHGGAMANLSFVVEEHTGVPVSGVPIEHPQSDEAIWIGEALANAGWPGADAFQRCFAYNNSIRDSFQTNWAFSYFICDSDPAVNQGLFQGGGYAWSYYGGPWIWMSRFSSWAYNAANYFEAVPEHEMGHTFYATDEYDGVQQTSGYMNWNDNASTSVICLMNQNVEWRLCQPTQRQLGWVDLDTDGIMAPLDVEPSAALDHYPWTPSSPPAPTWTGRAAVHTIPNLNPNDWRYSPRHDVTVATIDAVECRIDGGAWSSAVPADGTFDAYGEDYSWTSPPLPNGTHTVEARAHTTAGVWTATTYGTDTITVTGSVVDAPLLAADGPRFVVSPNPARGAAQFAWRVERGPVRLTVFDAAGRRVHARELPDTTGRIAWDGTARDGRPASAGVYLVQLESPGFHETKRLILVR